ncbi:MAG: hypothetical protein K2L72_04655 [Clostridia bacterium]|nr:hypothetical protein [Clostridia bacterium]
MTAKQFFKSTAFKCIAVLTCVLLVSGILLAIAYGFLEVTDEERFNRKIGAIYGGETVTATERDLSGKNTKVGDATIEKLWFIEEKNDYLVQAYSRGYGGNITCWITVNMQTNKTDVKGVGKVILYSVSDAAELVGYISSGIYDKFSTEYTDGKQFTYGDKTSGEYIGTGASYSLTAICSNVNGAVEFVKAFASGGDIVKDPFEDLEYNRLISQARTSWKADGETVAYHIVTRGNGASDPFTIDIEVDASLTVTKFEILVSGCTEEYKPQMSETALKLTGKTLADIEGYLADETEGGVLITGATKSNELCYHAAAFALANYQTCLTTPSKGGN